MEEMISMPITQLMYSLKVWINLKYEHGKLVYLDNGQGLFNTNEENQEGDYFENTKCEKGSDRFYPV